MVITHREYIRDISPSDAFTELDFPINPGLAQTFPWLSQLAESYEEYKIYACIFEFKSLCSDTVITAAGTSMGMGSVTMATNYNPNNDPFVDKRTMENYEGASSRKPSQSNVHIINVKKGSTAVPGLRWIRTGGIKENEDKRLYDIGTFSIATQGQSVSEGTIGELWVAYRIEFFKPKYSGSIGSNLRVDHYAYVVPGDYATYDVPGIFGPGVVVNTPPKGLVGAGTYLSASTAAGLDTLNFLGEHQGMTFFIVITYDGTAAFGSSQITAGTFTNVSTVQTMKKYTSSLVRTNDAIVTDTVLWAGTVRVDQTDANGPWNIIFTRTSNFLPVAPVYLDIWVTQINGVQQPVSL